MKPLSVTVDGREFELFETAAGMWGWWERINNGHYPKFYVNPDRFTTAAAAQQDAIRCVKEQKEKHHEA